MKIRHLFLGLAMVALMAACTKKAETTTPTTEATPTEETVTSESPVVEQPKEEVKEEAPVAKKETAKKETKTTKTEAKPKADPCEAAVKAYERYADEVAEAKKHKDTGDGLKAFVKLKKQADSQRAAIKDCASNPEYKTRVANAIRRVTNATM